MEFPPRAKAQKERLNASGGHLTSPLTAVTDSLQISLPLSGTYRPHAFLRPALIKENKTNKKNIPSYNTKVAQRKLQYFPLLKGRRKHFVSRGLSYWWWMAQVCPQTSMAVMKLPPLGEWNSILPQTPPPTPISSKSGDRPWVKRTHLTLQMQTSILKTKNMK